MVHEIHRNFEVRYLITIRRGDTGKLIKTNLKWSINEQIEIWFMVRVGVTECVCVCACMYVKL